MKGVKWKSFAVFVFGLVSLLLMSVTNSTSISALSLASASRWQPVSSTSYIYTGMQSYPIASGVMDGNSLLFQLEPFFENVAGFTDVTEMGFQTDRNIPSNALVSFDITFQLKDRSIEYYGLEFREGVTLSDTCFQNVPQGTANASTGNSYVLDDTISCSVLILTSFETGAFHTPQQTRLFKPIVPSTYFREPTFNVFIDGGSYRVLSNDSLSDSDKAWLRSVIPQSSSSSVQQISNDIEALKDNDEQDRENIEQQSSDSEDAASDSADDAEATGTTLLAAFQAFVNALTNASPSNCNLDMDLGNLDLGVVNLCQLSPPSQFQTIASIFLIIFCVPLSIATARKVISLFRSFQ